MPPRYLLVALSLAAIVGSLLSASANDHRYSGIFVISDITVSNDEAYEKYRKAVRPVIEGCGGTYVVRAGAKFVTDNPSTALLEAYGGWNPDRIIVLNFDSVEQANECFDSPEYAAAFALREGGASGKTLVVSAFRPGD